MLLKRPTAQNIPDALYVHHIMAADVMTMPSGVSMGINTPSTLIDSSGIRQYPSTLALLKKVSVVESSLAWWPCDGGGAAAAA